ncbi:MAG: hypothetical protein OSB10_10370 [Planctomycetota bacterium]|nr:hypothetical protein [Planctomycetota bacterium]
MIRKALIITALLMPTARGTYVFTSSPEQVAGHVHAIAAQEKGDSEKEDKVWPKCLKCKTTGKLVCPEHQKADALLEVDVDYCSFVYTDEVCGGTGWVSCPSCERSDVDLELGAKREKMPEIREIMVKMDEEMKFELHTAVSDHFVLTMEIDSLKVGKKRVKHHALIHLYLARLEKLYADYTTILQVKDSDFAERIRIFVWANDRDQADGSLRFCQQSAGEGVKLMGLHPTYSVCGTKRFHKGDEELHRNIIHNATHLLLSAQKPVDWIGNKKGGWADAGLAHWFEDRYFGVCDNYCYQEQNTNQDFKGGKWKPAVKKLVNMKEAPSVATVFTRNTGNLELDEHAVSFSYIDFLIQKDPKMLNLLLKRMRSKTPTRDALMEAFGLSVIEFGEEWEKWVKDTYPLR